MPQNNITTPPVPQPPPGFVPVTSGTISPPPPGFVPVGQSQTQDSTAPASQPSAVSAPEADEITIDPSDSLLTKAGKTVGGLLEGVGEGVFGTVAGASDLADKMTGATPGAANKYLHTLAGDNDTSHGTAQNVGRIGEDVAEFILGDSALKGLSVSDRLLQASKTAKLVESSPILSRVFQVGVRALRGATVAGTQAELKSGGNVPDSAGAAVTGGLLNAAIPEAADALQAARKALPGALDTIRIAIRPGIVQDAFQGQIRDIVNDAAKEYGVNPSSAQSIRDVAHEVSSNLQQKARQSYQALDELTGGRVQRFQDAIRAVEGKLRNLNGIATPDAEGDWIEKLNELTDAHEQAMQEASEALKTMGKSDTAQGVLKQADTDFRRSKAMLDLSKNIRASSEGLRPELASGAKTPIPESVNTGKLVNRVNKMYDAGRLQDALGQSRAADLLRAVNDSHVANQLAQSWRGIVKKYGGYAAAGALPFGGYELVRHLLGEGVSDYGTHVHVEP